MSIKKEFLVLTYVIKCEDGEEKFININFVKDEESFRETLEIFYVKAQLMSLLVVEEQKSPKRKLKSIEHCYKT